MAGVPSSGGGGPVIATDAVGTDNYQKIKLDLGGAGLSVPVVGALPISTPGLAGGILQTVTTLTNATTAYPIPATPLAGRGTLTVQAVKTNTASVWIGKSTVTADYAATGGLELVPGQTWAGDLAAGAVLYAASSAAGQKISTLEVAL